MPIPDVHVHVPPDFDAVGFARRLSERTGRPARVEDVTRVSRGVSRETWFVDCVEDRGGAERLVVRRDLPGAAVTPVSLRFEYEVYRRLVDSPVPVARPLWYEDEPDQLLDGREYYVREHVEGSWHLPHVSDRDHRYDDLRIGASKEHMRKLALVHTCDWVALGFGEIMDVPPSPAVAPLTAIDRLERVIRSIQREPFPIVTEALDVLRETAPGGAQVISLLKGTNGIGEEIWRDGEIVAMSDWELACLGDPASDFAHVQRLTPTIRDAAGETVWSLQHAVAYYEEVSGLSVDLGRVQYYHRMSALETVMYSHYAAIPLMDRSDLSARRGWVSTEVLFEAQKRLAETAGIL